MASGEERLAQESAAIMDVAPPSLSLPFCQFLLRYLNLLIFSVCVFKLILNSDVFILQIYD